jgi:release factor glutamine methyltransferase
VLCSLARILRRLGAPARLLATDVSPAAAAATAATLEAHGLRGAADVRVTDLVDALRPEIDGMVDLLLFNPPYVPTPDEEVLRGGLAAAWAGGHRGRRVVDRLLPLLPGLMSRRGEVLLVTVPDNDPQGERQGRRQRGAALPEARYRAPPGARCARSFAAT